MFGTMTLSEIRQRLREAYSETTDDPLGYFDERIRAAEKRGESTAYLRSLRALFEGPPNGLKRRKPRAASKSVRPSKIDAAAMKELEDLLRRLRREANKIRRSANAGKPGPGSRGKNNSKLSSKRRKRQVA